MATHMLGPLPFVIGNDILDFGSRKTARRQQGELGLATTQQLMLTGAPGQFDLPNVPDVSAEGKLLISASYCLFMRRSHLLLLFSGQSFTHSPPCIAVPTLPRPAAWAMKSNASNSPRAQRL
jgi:hypothetical protein